MSYILEALKKLEEKHRKESIPHIPTVHNIPAKHMSKRPLWPYFILLALLLNAGLLLWWFQPWQSPKADIAVRATDQRLLSTLPTSPSISHKNIAIQNRPLRVARSVNDTEISVAPHDVPVQISEPNRSYDNKQTRAAYISDKPEQKAVDTHELPSSLKQELPDLSISGHYYDSNPASRLVIINGKTLREGQLVMPGLKLEQIIASGVILSYQGCRFHKGVF